MTTDDDIATIAAETGYLPVAAAFALGRAGSVAGAIALLSEIDAEDDQT